jgi:hypothetical protein
MTEQEWLESTDPGPMLEFLRGKASDRKLRLFACACTRRVWEPMWKLDRYEPDGATVEAVEQLAEGPADSVKLAGVRGRASLEVDLLACEDAFGAAWWATEELPMAMPEWQDEMAPQADLLRDIFGNPFRPVVIEPSWLTWHDRCAGKIAQGIYDERAFDRLPTLADILEEAGCTNRNLLDHCHQPEPHVRGCFVVDALLGKT